MKKAIRTKDGFQVVHINRRRACRYTCLECMGYDETSICNGKDIDGQDCPLKDYRNMSGKQNAQERDKNIKAYCLECMNEQRHEISNCVAVYCPLFAYRKSTTDRDVLFNMDEKDEVILDLTNKLYEKRIQERKLHIEVIENNFESDSAI